MSNRVTRREVLRIGASAAVAGKLSRQAWAEQKKDPSGGEWYEAEVPDTLDLAERAGFAINALTGAADAKFNYETCEGAHLDQRPPYLSFRRSGDCLQENLHPVPMMRVMSGSTLNTDLDHKMMEAAVRDVDEKGLWWMKVEGRPYRAEFYKEDFVETSNTGKMVVALLDWHKYDPASGWNKLAGRIASGLTEVLQQQKDAKGVYYGEYFTRSGWKDLLGRPEPLYPVGLALWGLTRWYAVSGDERIRAKADELAEFMLHPSQWKTREGPTKVARAEYAHWEGQFHSHTNAMFGLLQYALTMNDSRAAEFVARFYEYSRLFGIPRIGHLTSWVAPLGESDGVDEGCDVADMTLLAAMLSEGGVGDYWDDVDQYTRNHLVERQVLRRDLVEEIVAVGAEKKIDRRMETDERVVDRQMGMFATLCDPTMTVGLWYTMCCMGNCSTALYKAWQSILRHDGGTVQVNLLLNRASPWLDVDSHLPYEGKVVLKNKTARKVFLRLPKWADKKAARCQVNHKDVQPHWLNNYLILEALTPRDTVTLSFPLQKTTEKHTDPNYGIEYVCQFLGNTLVEISPRAERPSRARGGSDDGSRFPNVKGYPMYRREFYRMGTAPQKKVQRYVSALLI